ncbi:uncharacterized protein METZ01_LOCUS377052, partial [marine metagenome]
MIKKSVSDLTNLKGRTLHHRRQFSVLRLRITVEVLVTIGMISCFTVTSFAQSVTTGQVVALAAENGTTTHASPEREAQESTVKLAWYDRIQWSGDFRTRYEGFYQKDRQGGNRNRGRLRLRLRMDSQINEDTKFQVQVASGDSGTPVSTNQTFSSFFRP